MKYQTLKCNFLYFIAKLFSSKDWKKLSNEYIKLLDIMPQERKLFSNALFTNFFFRRKHQNKFKIICVGWDCMPRSLLTLWMLKRSKGAGEKSLPFDLVGTTPKSAAHFLSNDFADYFDGDWVYKTFNNYTCWFNETHQNMLFGHEPDCGSDEAGLEKLKARAKTRIELFRQEIAFDGPILFVFHKATRHDRMPLSENHQPEDIERLCKEIARLRNGKPYKILVFACDQDDETANIQGECVEFVKLPYPTKDYIWHIDRYTREGLQFEINFVNVCRNAVADLIKDIPGRE